MVDELPTAARVSDPGIRGLYAQENRWQAWLDVETALAKAQADLGIIPPDAAEAIAAKAQLELLDRARIDEGFARTGHTIVPLVWELSRVVGEPHGGWVHWGATTQNITQTGDLMVLRQAHQVFLQLIGEALPGDGRSRRTRRRYADRRAHPWPARGARDLWLQARGVDRRADPPCRAAAPSGAADLRRDAGRRGGHFRLVGRSRARRCRRGSADSSGCCRCGCRRARSATTWPRTSACWACWRRPAARSGARSTR